MIARQQAPLPLALSRARRRFDQWRSRHRKHTRLPEELWRQAAAVAREHGLNRTARALGLKYYSLKKHLDEMTAEQAIPAKAEPEFIELMPGMMPSGTVECTIEWADGGGTTMRMHVKGARMADLVSFASALRSSQR